MKDNIEKPISAQTAVTIKILRMVYTIRRIFLQFRKFVAIGHTAVVVGINNPTIRKFFFFEAVKITTVFHSNKIICVFQLCFLKKGLRSGRTGTSITEFRYDLIFFHMAFSLTYEDQRT